MANEFARNLGDAGFSTTFTLPASASASTNQATPFDLGADTFKPEEVEVSLVIPALSSTLVPDTRTTTYIIETCTATNFSTIDATLYTKTFTASGGTGVAAQDIRVRLPSNCARYIRAKVTHGASTTDSSAISATVALKF